MSNIKLYKDNQKARNRYRIRVVQNKTEAIAIYIKDEKEALRFKCMLRKVLSAIESENND